MDVSFAEQRVLRLIHGDGNMEALSEWKIPYGKQLRILRKLMEGGFVVRFDDSVRLTESGIAAMNAQHSLRPTLIDPLEPAVILPLGIESIHLPDDGVF